MILSWIDKIMRKRISGQKTGNPSYPFFGKNGKGTSLFKSVRNLLCDKGCKFKTAAVLMVVFAVIFTAAVQSFALEHGDKIVNNAQLNVANSPSPVATSVSVTAVVRTPSIIEILTYAPLLPGAEHVNVSTTAYRSGSPSGPYADLPAPVPVGATTPVDLSSPVSLKESPLLHQGDPLFIRVTDLDQNLDSNIVETVFVTVTNSRNGDVEIIKLTETGPNTGVFTGYLPTSNGPLTLYNGSMSVKEGDNLRASYVDIADGSDTSAAAIMVDPFGIVFDSSTGLPVDGATITLIDTATGLPAVVFGDDGISSFPATIVSGGTATDGGGKVYTFSSGGYRFPFVYPGSYQYQITPPPGYVSPSTVPTPTIQSLPGGPFAIVDGSRGEVFGINPGPALRIDIPLDSGSASFWLQKTANKELAGHGDFIAYRLTVTNNSNLVIAGGVQIVDTLPVGFRYRNGSARLNGVPVADPSVSANGRTLTFTVGMMLAEASATIDYVAEVTAGTRLGSAINSAVAHDSTGGVSNTARATVKIQDDFMRTKSIIVGRVTTGECHEETGEGSTGLEGVRIYLEDGTFVISDKRGLFHFEGVNAGLHVVQLDRDSLPEGYEPYACTQNSRFAGRAFSQFVETQGGALWRADFHVRENEKPITPVPEKPAGEIILELTNAIENGNVNYTVSMRGNAAIHTARLNIILPEGVVYKNGSSMMNGVKTADPVQTDKTWLIFRLEDQPADWNHQITFGGIPSSAKKDEMLITQAYIAAYDDAQSDILTPPAETVLHWNKYVEVFQMPDVILRPQFSIRSADLKEADRKKLDEIADSLQGMRIDKIHVSGHTCNIPIAPQNRIYFADNDVLSMARAKTVAHYLMDKVKLPPEKIDVEGKGSSNPVANNRTEAGRVQNRRVEVVVTSSRVVDRSDLKVVKEKSGEKRAETKAVKTETKPEETKVQPDLAVPESPEGTITEKPGILYPSDNEILVGNIHSVRICLDSGLTPRLLVDQKEVSAKRIGFTMKDEKSGKTIFSYIGVDFGREGNRAIQLQGIDPFGNSRFEEKISVKRSGEIKTMRLKSAEGNVADGKTPVKLKLELYDAAGNIIPASARLDIREGTLAPLKQPDIFALAPAVGSHPQVEMSREGDVLFQPVNNSGLYRVVLGYNNIRVEAETYVQPKMREWILVGLAEGTLGYNTVSGNMENVSDAGQEEDFYKDGRVAFFAKGKIKGKWLLTMSYDSTKNDENMTGNSLFQSINPDTYYTLYGDTSQQLYDAASAKRLYVKIEREQFYAMFGDYDTGLTVTELSRYSRRVTGLKTEMHGKHFEVNAFASENDQLFKRDEIPGDGTSGMYRFSRNNILPNTEKITIEIRDRFRSEVLISSRTLNRFTDYSIDYDAGTVIFREPVHSRDENFNPIMIVAEYETFSSGGDDYSYGGRAGMKLLDNKLKAGGTYIHEGQGDGDSDLYGVDASWQIDDQTQLRGEYAKSDYSAGTTSRSGSAYLAEASRTARKYSAKVYYREQDAGFGLGQQPGSEAGTRKIGVEGSYHFTEKITADANVYRHYNLMTNATRDLAEGKIGYAEKNYGASVGFLHAYDRLGDGSKKESNQITMGGRMLTLYERLVLSLTHAQSIGSNDNSDFPTRTILGAEFAVTKKFTLLAAQEFTWGSGAETQTTRIGMRSSPWSGAELHSSVERQFNEDDERVFANVGMKQSWQVNKAWKVDAGVDRSHTISKSENYSFNTNVQPASGNREDFTALTGGATYQVKNLTWDNRLEFRFADTEDKWGLMSGLVKEVDGNWAWSARLQYFQTEAVSGLETNRLNLRHGLVYRPPLTTLIVLNRFDFIVDKQSGSAGADYDSWRLINNLHANYRPRKDTQLSMHYGAKYVQETIEGTDYSGYTDLIGAEGRYDINKDWDIGLHGSILHSWNASVFDYSSGMSVGYNIATNAWLSLGYNLAGFDDKDFSQANFTAQGPFVKFRFKFDQESVREAVRWLDGN